MGKKIKVKIEKIIGANNVEIKKYEKYISVHNNNTQF
jgi:hypothetical protein